MSGRCVRIGGAAGYWGDTPAGPEQLVLHGNVDYLVFDYLAEVTMAILAKARAKSPDAGYATDFITQVIRPLAREIAQRRIRVIANAGGVNLDACARAIRAALDEAGVALRVGVVAGDDLLDREAELRGRGLSEMFDGRPLPDKLASCNAYLGAFPIAAALDAGADIVVTGRVVDSAVTLGALIHEFGWQRDDWDRLAAGTLAGHLIECGCQATGGNFTDWAQVAGDWDRMGFPIAECYEDGSFVITKPDGTGGLVSPLTVGEQLVYEIDDPRAYRVPDVCCDFSGARLEQQAPQRVQVSGVRGRPPGAHYKVCATYGDGFRATFIQTVTGFDAARRARANGEAILSVSRRRLAREGLPDFLDSRIHLIGADTLWNPALWPPPQPRELVLRVDVRHARYAGCEAFSKEAAGSSLSMTTGRCAAGPTGRPKTTPVLRPFSFLLAKDEVPVSVQVDGRELAYDWRALASPAGEGAAAPGPSPADVAAPPADSPARVSVPLLRLAVARSGDKGNRSNIGVIARRPEYLPWIRAALPAERVRAAFAHTGTTQVERFELPGLHALNFLLHEALGGGGTVSLHLDVQGKTFAQQILHLPIDVPAALLTSEQGAGPAGGQAGDGVDQAALRGAVGEIQRHVQQQAQAHQARAWPETQQGIQREERRPVQQVEADAAAVGIVDRIGQQMVQVHGHGRHHEQPGPVPSPAEEQHGDEGRNQRMEDQMQDGGGRHREVGPGGGKPDLTLKRPLKHLGNAQPRP